MFNHHVNIKICRICTSKRNLCFPSPRSSRAGSLQPLRRRREQRRRGSLVDQPAVCQLVRWPLPAAYQMAVKGTPVLRTAVTTLTVRPQRVSGPRAPPLSTGTVTRPHHRLLPPLLRPLCPSPLPRHHPPQSKVAP